MQSLGARQMVLSLSVRDPVGFFGFPYPMTRYCRSAGRIF